MPTQRQIEDRQAHLRLPDGLTQAEIARELGLTRQAVQLAERSALRKAAAMLAARGVSFDDWREALRSL
jgi:transcriptional regulator